jgi:hypothetical protein
MGVVGARQVLAVGPEILRLVPALVTLVTMVTLAPRGALHLEFVKLFQVGLAGSVDMVGLLVQALLAVWAAAGDTEAVHSYVHAEIIFLVEGRLAEAMAVT